MRELRMERKFRRRTVAQIGEDQAEIFAHRVGPQPDLAGEPRLFRRLLDALPVAVVLPAVIEAADGIAFDISGRQCRTAMAAIGIDQVRRSGLAAVERETLAQNLQRLRLPDSKVD